MLAARAEARARAALRAEVTAEDAEAERRGIPASECERLIAQLKREGTVYEPREGYLKKT